MSYHLLSLLEVADPSLHLRDTFHLWTVPAETVRLLAQQPGLVGDIVYRPSRSTQVRRKREALSSPERRWLKRVIRDPSEALSPEFAALPPARRALLLDTASDYFRYERAGDPGDADSYKAKNRTVLIERSKLRIPSPDIEIKPWTASPEKGHDTSRAGVGIGWRGSELITDVSFRVAYHDLLDPDAGYSPDEQIELLGVVVRYYEERNQARLEELTFVDVVSLFVAGSLARYDVLGWKSILDGDDNSLRIYFEEVFDRFHSFTIDALLAALEDPFFNFRSQLVPSQASPYSHDHPRFPGDPNYEV